MNSKIRVPDFNNVVLIGRLTKEPKLGFTQKGSAVCTFDIAVNRSYKDAGGGWQQEVTYIPIRVWREAATRCGERLKKGSPVLVTGRLRTLSWEDKEGKKRNMLEVEANKVQFMEYVSEGAAPAGEEPAPQRQEPQEETGQQEEEIPF